MVFIRVRKTAKWLLASSQSVMEQLRPTVRISINFDFFSIYWKSVEKIPSFIKIVQE